MHTDAELKALAWVLPPCIGSFKNTEDVFGPRPSPTMELASFHHGSTRANGD